MSAAVHRLEVERAIRDSVQDFAETHDQAKEMIQRLQRINLAELPARRRTKAIKDYLDTKFVLAMSSPGFAKALNAAALAKGGPVSGEEFDELLDHAVPGTFEVYLCSR